MAARVVPGGVSSVSLGTVDTKSVFAEWKEEHQAAVETPDALPRFPQAPGGTASLSLSGDSAAGEQVAPTPGRAAVGGTSSVVLGTDDSRSRFAQPSGDSQDAVDAPQPAARFPQPPGGHTDICLGGGVPPPLTVRGPVGGSSTVVLGTDDNQDAFVHEEPQVAETPVVPSRFQQAPGGSSSIDLGGATSEATKHSEAVRGPVGGAAQVVLGSDSCAEIFAQRKHEREAAIETPVAAPRFQQAPGGTSTLSFEAAQGSDLPGGEDPVSRPVGGAATVVLGSDSAQAAFSHYQADHKGAIQTPDAVPRFTQAPGGTSTVSLAGDDSGAPDTKVTRGPVGGATTICIGDVGGLPVQEAASRGPVGGAASVVLGTDDLREAFEERREERKVPTIAAEGAPRFTQAPGGTASICLAGDAVATEATVRGPVAGASSIVLGSDELADLLRERKEQLSAPVETPVAVSRFTQAPGGTESSHWARDASESSQVPAIRCPVGGEASVLLGTDDSTATFRSYADSHAAAVATEAGAPRFQQAPGGASTVTLAEDSAAEAPVAVRGPVGGASTVILGEDAPEERRQVLAADVATPGPVPRFQQAPGGDSSLCLSSSDEKVDQSQSTVPGARAEVGGKASIILGVDDSSALLAERQQQRDSTVQTPAAPQRFPQAPGGTASVLLAGGTPDATAVRGTPGGAASLVLGGDYPHDLVEKQAKQSSNAFARGSNQNSGNVLTERPTTRLHQAPGGTSTITLGSSDRKASTKARARKASVDRSKRAASPPVAARPAARQQQAPGGTATITLGAAANPTAAEKVSSSRFATGSNQNCGNVLTERPTTRLHQAPGGTSTLVLGAEGAEEANTRASGKSVPPTQRQQAPGDKKPTSVVKAAVDENANTANLASVQQDKVGAGVLTQNPRIVLG